MFTTEEIKRDHWNKTHVVCSGYRRSQVCKIARDIAEISEPQGKKFLETSIIGIANYVCIDDTVIRRRETVTA